MKNEGHGEEEVSTATGPFTGGGRTPVLPASDEAESSEISTDCLANALAAAGSEYLRELVAEHGRRDVHLTRN